MLLMALGHTMWAEDTAQDFINQLVLNIPSSALLKHWKDLDVFKRTVAGVSQEESWDTFDSVLGLG